MSLHHFDLTVPLILASADPRACTDPCIPPGTGAHCEPWIDAAGRERGYTVTEKESVYIRLFGVGSFHCSPGAPAVRGTPERGVAPDVFQDVFRRCIVPLVLQRRDWEVLHASCLEIAGRCVALCGSSEQGKSTLAYAWHSRGGGVLADDALPFRLEQGQAWVYPIPFRFRLRAPVIGCFAGAGEERMESSGRDDVALTSDRAALGTIYLLERRREDAGPVTLEPVEPQKALAELLGQALCLTLRDPDRNRDMVARYIALADRVPVYRLSYPTELGRVGAILDRLVDHVSPAPAP